VRAENKTARREGEISFKTARRKAKNDLAKNTQVNKKRSHV